MTSRRLSGYVGSILYINLSEGVITRKPLNLALAKKFVGGPGIGFHILHELLPPRCDPHSEKNVMVFGTGPMIGTPVPGASKCYLATKYAMPADRKAGKFFISSSMFGSNRFGVMLKNAGYDHVVICGRSEYPCYLKISDKDVEICDAAEIWGQDIFETAKILRRKYKGSTGPCGTWTIGQGGENLVRPSLGFTDDWHNAGRFAASVAGAKNLKAIVTLGAKGIGVADKEKLRELLQKKRDEIIGNPKFRINRPMPGGKPGEILKETLVGERGCNSGISCACKTVHEISQGEFAGTWWGGSFRTAPFRIQSRLGLKSPEEGFVLIELLNKYGLCRFTFANMAWFLTKLYERGVISKDIFGGVDLKPGDLSSYIALVEKIISRQAIGFHMAEGWFSLCEAVGADASMDWDAGCPITKGVDVIVDSRTFPSLLSPSPGFSPAMGLSEVVNAKAKHSHSCTYWSKEELSLEDIKKDAIRMGLGEEDLNRIFEGDSFNTGRLTVYDVDAEAAYNALGICDTCFHPQYDPMRDIPWLSQAYKALTGFELSPRDLLRAGERIWNLERLLNVREGFSREDDSVPPLYKQNMSVPMEAVEGRRYLCDWLGKRLNEGDLARMLDEYYEERGWSIQTGIPQVGKLEELGLEQYR